MGSRGTKKQINQETLNSAKEQAEKFNKGIEDIANKLMKEGMTANEAVGMSPSYLENVYAQAYRLYNTGKYQEATNLFRILIMLNPMEAKYMLGLAASFHMLKEYDNAIQIYTMCSVIDPQTPIPHYHSADCYIQMKDFISAMISLELAVERAKDKPEFAKIKERSQMSLQSLKEQVTSSPAEEEQN